LSNSKSRYGFASVLFRGLALGTALGTFLFLPRGGLSGVSWIIGFAVLSILYIYFIIAEYGDRFASPLGIYVDLVSYLTIFVLLFSLLYWNYGTPANFNISLTRLDAIYFSIGTLSTAGTGNLNATSELARGLQALQMVLDLGFLLIAVTLVVNRLASSKASHRLFLTVRLRTAERPPPSALTGPESLLPGRFSIR
jgi:Ion channel